MGSAGAGEGDGPAGGDGPVESATRARIVSAAAGLACDMGWASVTMSAVGGAAGVSRQTVYNEFRGKPALGAAVVEAQFRRFLSAVDARLVGARPGSDAGAGVAGDRPGVAGGAGAPPGVAGGAGDDAAADLCAAAGDVLRMAQDDPLLREVVAGAHGRPSALLPLLTVDSLPLLRQASELVAARLRERYPQTASTLPGSRLELAAEAVVRLVLSYVLQPSRPPGAAMQAITLLVDSILLAHSAPAPAPSASAPSPSAHPGSATEMAPELSGIRNSGPQR